MAQTSDQQFEFDSIRAKAKPRIGQLVEQYQEAGHGDTPSSRILLSMKR